jgi:hypothetical protein
MKAYIMRSLVAFDQFVNVVFGGLPGETISAHWGRMAKQDKLIGRVGSWCLNRLQRGHTTDAIQHDKERAEAIVKVEEKAERGLLTPESR